MSYYLLQAQAFLIRQLSTLPFNAHNAAYPPASGPDESFSIDATVGEYQAKDAIGVKVYLPKGHPRLLSSAQGTAGQSTTTIGGEKSYMTVINFHGGGYVFGNATDNSRWSRACTGCLDLSSVEDRSEVELGDGQSEGVVGKDSVGEQGAVVFSIDYRLAPSYPFPTAFEDCLSAFIAIIASATGDDTSNSTSSANTKSTNPLSSKRGTNPFKLDLHSIHFSGFSAGANLALSLWTILQSPSSSSSSSPSSSSSSTTPNPSTSPINTYDYTPLIPLPASYSITSLTLFYPIIDWSLPRSVKLSHAVRPDLALPPWFASIFGDSYVPPSMRAGFDFKNDLRLSPANMPGELMRRLPRVGFTLCEWDMLMYESNLFAERMKALGKVDEGGRVMDEEVEVRVRVVKEGKHGWDTPFPVQPEKSVLVEYKAARDWIWRGGDKGEGGGLRRQRSRL